MLVKIVMLTFLSCWIFSSSTVSDSYWRGG
jgi:hypothetical protein